MRRAHGARIIDEHGSPPSDRRIAAGVAGALAMSPDAARAAPLTSTLGRDVTQYGVRPAVPTTKPKICNARSMKPRARKRRWRCRRASIAPACFASKRHATGRRARRDQTRLHGGASMLLSEGAE
jgi:hypothetical protein